MSSVALSKPNGKARNPITSFFRPADSKPLPFRLPDEPAKDSIHTILREGRKLITPNLAKRILEETNFKGQRPVAAHHVELLAHIMREHRWRSGDQLAFCRLGGFLIMTNGQHRMHAVVESGIAQEFQILITECATDADVEEDYRRHDIVSRKRSTAEIVGPSAVASETGLPRGFLVQLYKAAATLAGGLHYTHYVEDPVGTRDVERRMEVVREWANEAVLYDQLIRHAPRNIKRHLLNAGVMAVALTTIRHQPAKAAEFWRGLADDDGLRKGDPRKTLMQDFEMRNVQKGAFHNQRVIPAITAWNAFYEGRTLKVIKVSESSQISVRGTPIKG